MLLKNKGFYMAELLVSLTGWILIAGIIVPMLMQVILQNKSLQQKANALHIFYEYVQTAMINDGEKENYSEIRDATLYEIKWLDDSVAGLQEVYITYENVFGKTVQLRETVP